MRTLLTALVVVFATPALADLTVVTEVSTAGKKRVVTVSLKGQRSFMSLEEEGKSPPVIVRDGAAKQMFVIDHRNKTVVKAAEPNEEEVKLRQEQFKQQMAAQLARLPPEQRKKMEERLFPAGVGASPAPLTYEKKKAPARKVNGFSCEDYVIKREGQIAGEGCFAPFKDFKFTAAEYQEAFKAALPKSALPGQQHGFDTDQLAPGIAVLRTLVDASGNVTSETTLKSLSKTALPADKFEVPKDYTVKAAADLMPQPVPPPAPAPKK